MPETVDWIGLEFLIFLIINFLNQLFLGNVLVEPTGLVRNLMLITQNGINIYSLRMAI